jgi:Rieske Fe-S protein
MSPPTSPAAASRPPRREVLHTAACLGLACLAGPVPPVRAQAPSEVRRYERTLLVDRSGQPFTSGRLALGEPHVFHYPYASTPVFLLALPGAPTAVELSDDAQHRYRSLPGVGRRQNVVAYSAICAHKLMYPTPQISFIHIRSGHAGEPAQVVHCCGDNSRYDPAQGGKVIGGPAPQPLATILLDWDPASDQLHAVGTLGGEMFQAFFDKYEFRLSLDHGARWKERSGRTAVVQTAASYSRQVQSCKA